MDCVAVFEAPPPGEIRFQFSAAAAYRREIQQCRLCRHFLSTCHAENSELYQGDYVTSNYSDEAGIRRNFERIMNLDSHKSDNKGRVARVLAFASQYFEECEKRRPHSILDVGSGLCVFLAEMKASGWDCTALDPDPRSMRHAQRTVQVHAVCGNFMEVRDLGRFDVVTFNKVLEHVRDPLALLVKARTHLAETGFVYVEVPDGEAARREGFEREEFFIDHLHVFSGPSLAMLATRAGFVVLELERLREPSGKYTLRAFLIPSPDVS